MILITVIGSGRVCSCGVREYEGGEPLHDGVHPLHVQVEDPCHRFLLCLNVFYYV